MNELKMEVTWHSCLEDNEYDLPKKNGRYIIVLADGTTLGKPIVTTAEFVIPAHKALSWLYPDERPSEDRKNEFDKKFPEGCFTMFDHEYGIEYEKLIAWCDISEKRITNAVMKAFTSEEKK